MYLVPVAEFDLKYFQSSNFLGINCLPGLIFYFPAVLILGQGRTLVPRGILRTIGLPLSHRRVSPTRSTGGGNLSPKYLDYCLGDNGCVNSAYGNREYQ